MSAQPTAAQVVAFVPAGARVLVLGDVGESVAGSLDGVGSVVTTGEADTFEELGEARFDVVVLVDLLEHLDDPRSTLRGVQSLLAEDGAVVASIANAAHGSVRLALLDGRVDGLLERRPVRLLARQSIEDLFEETGYVITHWARERSEIEGSALLGRDSIRELLEADPESTTSRFVVRAVPSEAAGQLAAAHGELRAAKEELAEAKRERDDLRGTSEELEAARAELEALRRAHEERGRRLVAERLEFSNELGELQRHIETIHHSRSFRYTAVFRRLFGTLRRRG